MNKCMWCGKDLSERQIKRRNPCCSYSCANRYRYRNVQKEYVCQGCGKTYIKNKPGRVQGTKYCSKECGRKSNLGKKFSSEHCRKIAEAQRGVRVEGIFHCDRCGKPFGSNTEMRSHKTHCGHLVVLHRCFNCGKSYKGLAGLQRHQIWCIDNKKNIKSRRVVKIASAISNIRRLKNGTSGILNRDTKPELEVAWRLEQEGIKFEKQFSGVGGVNHCYDFKIKDYVIVEVDGDYWHGNPKKYPLTNRQKKQYHIDLKNTIRARSSGFKVLRYWASDVLGKPKNVVSDIIRVIAGKEPKLTRNM